MEHSRHSSSRRGISRADSPERGYIFDLDEREAFAALSLFLSRFAERAGDDLATLLMDITLMPDGGTVDPAAWDDWLDCVRSVKEVSGGSGGLESS